MWYQMLCQKGYIVVSIDNRGTGGRGAEFKKCTYKELGKLETIDQIEGAKYLAKQSYVDKQKIINIRFIKILSLCLIFIKALPPLIISINRHYLVCH